RDIQQSWQVPAELTSMPCPRPVRIRTSSRIRGLFYLMLLVALEWFVALPALKREELLSREGKPAEARVVKKWVTHDEDDKFSVTYTFEANGRIYRSTTSISSAVYSRLKDGALLDMHYAASRP